MEEEQTPGRTYAANISEFNQQLPGLYRKRNLLGFSRLSLVILPLLLVYFFLPGQVYVFIPGLLLAIILFLWLVVLDLNNGRKITHLQQLISINEEEIRIAGGQYLERNGGNKWAAEEHEYAADMDIFGRASLFQFYNRCSSEPGMRLLAERFQTPLPLHRIHEQQDAVREIREMVEWRQEWQARGMESVFTTDTEARVSKWIGMDESINGKRTWTILLVVFPMISLATLIFFLAGTIGFPLFIVLMIFYYFISGLQGKAVNAGHGHLSRTVPQINTLYRQLELLEKAEWKSYRMNSLKTVVASDSHSAGKALGQLKKILGRFDVRFNALVSPLLNIFLLWDIRQFLQLQEWKREYRGHLHEWIRAMAETEVLVTMATFSFNHPAYGFPAVDDQFFHLTVRDIGHPLIPAEKRVVNDCRIMGNGQVMLITGSNMAGKSTFLRSMGINTVLALMGSPVCAKDLSLSHVQLISSMRISDNLAENTSTFYAELKKLKVIIDRVNQGEQLLILLDEILRGTNSFDRHTGSEALVEQLIRQHAVAMVATHDVELAALEKKYPEALHNHHFDVQVKGEELYFDFKLREGVCQSMNASILMKKIGIRLS